MPFSSSFGRICCGPGDVYKRQALEGLVLGQLLRDALGGDNVGVNTHADAEDNTGNAGQRQRGAGENREIAGRCV